MDLSLLAKPNKTIRKHTDELLKNSKILFKNDYIKKNEKYILDIACKYHDYGKINEEFQKRVRSKGKVPFNGNKEVGHNILSIFAVNSENLSPEDYKKICYSIFNHHYFVDNMTEMEEKEDIILKFINENNLKCKSDGFKFFNKSKIFIKRIKKEFEKIEMEVSTIKLKGLLHKCDYAASGEYKIEYKNDFLLDSLKNLNYKWNDLQKFALKNAENNVVIIANTGMGKTEAGLLWIGDKKGFFILPLKTAINSIYERIVSGIVKNKIEERIGILHSSSIEELISLKEKYEIDNSLQCYERGKKLSLPLSISTLDQMFDFVYKYNGFELKLATLSYSKTVIDEIQAYSPDLLAYLISGIEKIKKIEGKFAILTATLPPFIYDKIKQAVPDIKFEKFIKGDDRHSIKIINSEINSEEIYNHFLEKGKKTLVICNTVKESQKLYEKLRKKGIEANKIKLFHAKFIKKDREIKEREILKIGRTEHEEDCIWISTSLVEASLDIDFDYLFTELNDLSGVFQRMGRVNRKGKKYFILKEPNVYIFTKINNKLFINEKGTKGFIDKSIYDLSIEALTGVDGILSEEKKWKLMEQYFTSENLKNSSFDRKYRQVKDYIDGLNIGEKDIREVKKQFRNIVSYKIIPEPIYSINENRISELEKKLNENIENNNFEAKEKFIKMKMELESYTVSVGIGDFDNLKIKKKIKIKNEEIPILDCDYDSDIGFKRKENDKERFDNFI